MFSLLKTFSDALCKTATCTLPLPNCTSLVTARTAKTLVGLHARNMRFMENPNPKPKKSIFNGAPFAKGVVLRTVVKKPRKPNSANRKCVVVRLSTGKEMVAYVPGVGHNLQEHQVVLCKVARVQDVPGLKIKCVRGCYDLPHVSKRGS